MDKLTAAKLAHAYPGVPDLCDDADPSICEDVAELIEGFQPEIWDTPRHYREQL